MQEECKAIPAKCLKTCFEISDAGRLDAMDDTLNGMDRIEDRNLNDAVMKAIELIRAGQTPGDAVHLAAKPCHLSEIAYYVGQWSGSNKCREELTGGSGTSASSSSETEAPDFETLKHLPPEDLIDSFVAPTDEIRELLVAYSEAVRSEKEAKECRQAIAEKLGCFMGHYSGIADRDGTMYCTWKSRSIRRFSQDLLEERHPDLVSVIEDCYTERPTRFLRICNGVHEI